jgi:hypothetical protein
MDSLFKGNTESQLYHKRKWIKRFNLNDYIGNPPLIEKLHEEKQLALIDAAVLREQLDTTRKQLQALQFKDQAHQEKLDQSARQSTYAFILSLLATVLLGLGVNVATTKPDDRLGWILIGSAVVVQCVAFLLKPGKSNG